MTIRIATREEVPKLEALIARSVRELQADYYTHAEREAALAEVYGVDTQLIHDGTYYVVEHEGRLAACGGWSKRKTLFGGDHAAHREDEPLDPATDAARIRAFFVSPDFARQGVGTLMLKTCEDAARAEGFTRFELASTLSGVALYSARGYAFGERFEVPIRDGESIGIVRMSKTD